MGIVSALHMGTAPKSIFITMVNQPEAGLLATRWADITCTREDEVACDQSRILPLTVNIHMLLFVIPHSRYFELAVPRTECEVIELDTTVECWLSSS